MKILGVIVAHDEVITIPEVIKCFRNNSIPYIAILDNPSPEIRWMLRHAIDTYEMPPIIPHVYRWAEILQLMDWSIRRPHGYDWVLRIDADEIWPDVRKEVEEAENNGQDIINFGIKNFIPNLEKLPAGLNFIEHCSPAEPGDDLWLPERFTGPGNGNLYHRAWSLRKPWLLYGGGHMINRSTNPKIGHADLLATQKKRTKESKLIFNHYPAVSREALIKKVNRPLLEHEVKTGWHNQYNKVKAHIIPTPDNSKLKVFYHVATMKCYREIIQEQIACVGKSGLLTAAKMEISYVTDDVIPEIPLVSNFHNKRVGKITDFEFPTLGVLWDYCKANPDDLVLYIHTKGASKQNQFAHNHPWREYLMWGCVEHWERCTAALREGYDSAGVEWSEGRYMDPFNVKCSGLWAGNIWWARADWIIQLPDPRKLDVSNRWNAEGWIGMGPRMPRVKCFYDTRVMGAGRRGWEFHDWGRDKYAEPPKQRWAPIGTPGGRKDVV